MVRLGTAAASSRLTQRAPQHAHAGLGCRRQPPLALPLALLLLLRLNARLERKGPHRLLLLLLRLLWWHIGLHPCTGTSQVPSLLRPYSARLRPQLQLPRVATLLPRSLSYHALLSQVRQNRRQQPALQNL